MAFDTDSVTNRDFDRIIALLERQNDQIQKQLSKSSDKLDSVLSTSLENKLRIENLQETVANLKDRQEDLIKRSSEAGAAAKKERYALYAALYTLYATLGSGLAEGLHTVLEPFFK